MHSMPILFRNIVERREAPEGEGTRGGKPPATGGGVPRENVWKMDANDAFYAYFFRNIVDFLPKSVCNFCPEITDLRDAGEFSP